MKPKRSSCYDPATRISDSSLKDILLLQIICGPSSSLNLLWCHYPSDPQGVRLALTSPASLSGGFYLLFGDAHVILDPREDGGLNEEALVAHRRAPILQPGSLLLAALYQIHNLVKLLLVNLKGHRE